MTMKTPVNHRMPTKETFTEAGESTFRTIILQDQFVTDPLLGTPAGLPMLVAIAVLARDRFLMIKGKLRSTHQQPLVWGLTSGNGRMIEQLSSEFPLALEDEAAAAEKLAEIDAEDLAGFGPPQEDEVLWSVIEALTYLAPRARRRLQLAH